MGHLFRSARIAAGLADHEVLLLAGGPIVPLELPGNVRLVRQRGLCSDETFSSLLPCEPGDDLETIKACRAAQLLEIMESFRPDVLLIEQYPFGRGMFRFELEPCLEGIRKGRFGPVKVVCSLRDILSVRRDQEHFESKVIRRMAQDFDAILVHGDPALVTLDTTFGRVADLPAPVHYTGYVVLDQESITNLGRETLRARLGIETHERLVVAGFGAGHVGKDLAVNLVKAFRQESLAGIKLLLFTGPLAGEQHMATLKAQAADLLQVRIESFTSCFSSYVAAADGVVTMGGYNTCMDFLSARVPALVHPLYGEGEQALRCSTLQSHGLCEVLGQGEMETPSLAERIFKMLNAPAGVKDEFQPDMDGVRKTAVLLEQIVAGAL